MLPLRYLVKNSKEKRVFELVHDKGGIGRPNSKRVAVVLDRFDTFLSELTVKQPDSCICVHLTDHSGKFEGGAKSDRQTGSSASSRDRDVRFHGKHPSREVLAEWGLLRTPPSQRSNGSPKPASQRMRRFD